MRDRLKSNFWSVPFVLLLLAAADVTLRIHYSNKTQSAQLPLLHDPILLSEGRRVLYSAKKATMGST